MFEFAQIKELSMLALILLTAFVAVAQPQSPRPPQAPPVAVEKINPPKATISKVAAMSDDYNTHRARAVEKGMPLIVFIRMEKRPVVGAIVCRVDHLSGYDSGPSIVIGVPDKKLGMIWRATLTTDATDAEIRKEIGPAPLPFFKTLREKREQRIADDSDIKRQLPFLSDMEPYTTAKRVQFSFRRWSGFISSVPRSQAKEEWNVAGGLLGVSGWSSLLYKKANAREYLGYHPDGAITWQRSYADGAIFAEVLRNDNGTVFEVRYAEKQDGQWDRHVAYRNSSAYPSGYTPVKSSACVSCHAKSGETLYGGSPAVPGGDTILSDPISRVESGETVQGGYGLRL